MVHSPSFSRDDQRRFQERSSATINPHLPAVGTDSRSELASLDGTLGDCCKIDASQLEKAKAALLIQRHGVSGKDVLSAVKEQSWVLDQEVSSSSLDLTRLICHLNESLLANYQAQAASESFVERLLSTLPVVGELPARDRYLQSIRDVNELVSELQEAGLVQVVPNSTSSAFLSARVPWAVQYSSLFFVLTATELGKRVLEEYS